MGAGESVMKKAIILLALYLSSCVTLATRQERTISKVINTTVTKEEAYNRALVWFAKNLNNSNWAVQVKDEKTGRIIANIRYTCSNISPM